MSARTAPDIAESESNVRQWLPGLLVLAAIWGSSFLFIKVGVRELHPMHLALVRSATGAATLVAVLLVTRTRLPRAAHGVEDLRGGDPHLPDAEQPDEAMDAGLHERGPPLPRCG